MNIDKLPTSEIIELYPQIIREPKKRGVIRTNNFIGDLGEYLVIDYYKKTAGLPTLLAAPISTKNIDAISNDGDRYTIKTTSKKVTGVFYGLEPLGSDQPDKQKFEYAIICSFDKDYSLKAIYELDWEHFMAHKKWHSRMNAWNIALTSSTIKDCRIIYQRNKG